MHAWDVLYVFGLQTNESIIVLRYARNKYALLSGFFLQSRSRHHNDVARRRVTCVCFRSEFPNGKNIFSFYRDELHERTHTAVRDAPRCGIRQAASGKPTVPVLFYLYIHSTRSAAGSGRIYHLPSNTIYFVAKIITL
jgi:hypothetical protein